MTQVQLSMEKHGKSMTDMSKCVQGGEILQLKHLFKMVSAIIPLEINLSLNFENNTYSFMSNPCAMRTSVKKKKKRRNK